MEEFSLVASDGHTVACYRWVIDAPKAVVHIAHGMGEHAKRYDGVARALNAAGYSVYANDHRGHGVTGQGNLGYMGPDGWNRTLADAFEINQLIKSNHLATPVVLLGHSMGSMLGQLYLAKHSASIDALVLSGSPGFKAKSYNPIPRWILKFETWRVGKNGASAAMQSLLFGGSNKPFEGEESTGFEWLSRDPEQVRKYVQDPQCGFVLATGSLQDLYAGAAPTQDSEALRQVRGELPIYVFAGADDPLHGEQQDIERMVEAYRQAGLLNLTLKWYAQGRHEMFNEINRDEVIADLVAWLAKL